MVRRALMVVAALAVVLSSFPALALADGAVVLSTTYPSVVADKGKQITFPVDVVNRTGDFQQVDVRVVDGPADWTPDLRSSGFSVRSVMLEPNKSQSIDFSATPPAAAKAGDYAFVLRAFSGGSVISELRIAVTLRDAVSSGLKLSTQFPNVRGQAGNTFSFTFDLVNQAGIDRDIGLSAAAPSGWQVTFKPVGDSKQVSSFRVKAGDTQSIDVEVAAPQKVDAGDYDITLQATSGTDKTQSPLKITILGQSSLSFTTTSGNLNTTATVDQDTKVAFVIKNTGSAPLQNITFSSSPPDGWTVTFQPDHVATLGPDQQQDVSAVIRPGSRALAGDYMVTLTAGASGTSSSQDLRVTVNTPTAWGIIGLLAIVAVLGGLGWVFVRYSRR
ncbi:MAG: hypothetical protein KGK34_02865 [Chloroflexota bacterium]|nr:hypothetical protein [Chloroflexota bacterium]